MSSRPKPTRPKAKTRRRTLALVGALAAGSLPFVGAGTAQAASAADWQKLAVCESGGDWHINTGNGYYGGLQFSSGTWLGFGGGTYASRADLASPEQQMAIADKVLAVQGWNAWPSCSRSTGLYGTPTTPSPTPPPPPLVYGAIKERYDALGGAGGVLGVPLTGEAGSVREGRYNLFAGGVIYYTPQHGAWEAHGAILAAWRALGSEFTGLGYPISNEQPTARGGAANTFEGGVISWSPATGAHAVRGGILETWKAKGREGGALGFPTTDELATTAKPGALSRFQGGTIAYSATTGSRVVQGGINEKWTQLGSEGSALGFPTSNEFNVDGGRRSNFEHGTITWKQSGSMVVRIR